MNRRYVPSVIPVLIILLAVLTGCTAASKYNTEWIGRPANPETPVSGTWQLEKCLPGEEKEISKANPMHGETIGFSSDALLFGGSYYGNIGYKVKRVSVNEYFLHKGSGLPEKLGLKSNEVFIFTVYSDDKYLFELIRSPDGKIVASIEDQYYYLKKISDKPPDEQEALSIAAERAELFDSKNANQKLRSGLLLGVRIPVPAAGGKEDYTYATYWISCEDRTLNPILSAPDIYLPRMDGFWKLRVEKKMGWEGLEDVLVAYKVSGVERKQAGSNMEDISKRAETKMRDAIVYVGNDYVCVEKTVYDIQDGAVSEGVEKKLRTLPVDNLEYSDGIKISDLAGENGKIAMENAVSELLKDTQRNSTINIDEDSQPRNFALYRKTGHWFLKGRVNLTRQDPIPFMDFSLNLIPPANMVAYDVLHVPWKEMKDRLPDAYDIYTSPNKDLAVVLARDEALLYTIADKKLSEDPAARFTPGKGSSVIMAEWCMGDYVSSWEKSFLKNNEAGTIKKH